MLRSRQLHGLLSRAAELVSARPNTEARAQLCVYVERELLASCQPEQLLLTACAGLLYPSGVEPNTCLFPLSSF